MAKKSDLFASLRERRGLNQKMLADLSGRSLRTVSSAEADPDSVSEETLQSVMVGLASAAPFSTGEVAKIVADLSLAPEAVLGFNEKAHHSRTYADTISEAQRASHAFSQLSELTPELADVLDAVLRLCVAHTNQSEQRLLRDPGLTGIIRDVTRRQFVELLQSVIEKKDRNEYYYTAHLPSEVFDEFQTYPVEYYDAKGRRLTPREYASPADPTEALSAQIDADLATITGGGPGRPGVRRVVLPPERRSDGALVERFEYYTPDGRRLIPAPPGPAESTAPAKPKARAIKPEDPESKRSAK